MRGIKIPMMVLASSVMVIAGAVILSGCTSGPCGAKRCSSAVKDTSGGDLRASMAFPTGMKSNSVIWIEKTMPRQVRAGQPFDYQIKVCNLTEMNVSDVVVTEKVSDKFTINKSVPEAQSTGAGTVKWDIGSLGPKQCKLITVNGTMSVSGELPCCTNVTYSTVPPQLCVTPQAIAPAIQLAAQGPADSLLCSVIPVKLTVSSTGTGTARDVKVSVALPAGLVTEGDEKSAVAYAIGSLASGQSRVLNLKLQASKPGTYDIKAKATGEDGLAAEASPVTVVVKQPALQVSESGPSSVYIGRTGDFTISVQNAGNATADETVVESRVSSSMRVVAASEGGRASRNGAVWNLGALQPGQSRSLSMTAEGVSDGAVQSTVVAKAYCCSDATAQAASQVKGVAGILLEMVDVEDPISVGKSETFIISVTNQGSAPDNNVKVKAILESSMSLVSTSGVTKGASSDNQTVEFEALPSLAPKAKAVWKVVAKSSTAGQHIFTVKLTSDMLSRGVDKTESTTIY